MKYKIFDTISNKYREDIIVYGNGRLGLIYEDISGEVNIIEPILNTNGLIIEQYTGINDIDGNEIYESDILQFEDEQTIYGYDKFILKYSFQLMRWVMYYVDNNMEVKRSVMYEWRDWFKEIKIIGNIHDESAL